MVLEREAAPEDGLGDEAEAEACLDPRANLSRKGGDVGRMRALAADDGEAVARGQRDRPRPLASAEAGALDEPGRRELDMPVGLRPTRHGGIGGGERQALERPAVHHRVQEEGAAAPPVGIVRVEHHGLGAADVEHARAHVGEGRGGGAPPPPFFTACCTWKISPSFWAISVAPVCLRLMIQTFSFAPG